MRIRPPTSDDAEALADLHLDVWEEAYAYLWVLDGNARAIGFYERQGFAFDGTTVPEDVGLHRRMVRGA